MGAHKSDDENYEWLIAWRNGDRAKGELLYQRYAPSVTRFFRSKVSDDTTATDLVHKTFMGCVETKTPFDRRSTVRTYLFSIARNKLFRYFRERKKHAGVVPLEERTSEEFGPDPHFVLVQRREHRLLMKALRRLPLDLQIALELDYWEGMKGREIAEVLGVKYPTIRGRLRRGKQQLMKQMATLAESPELLASTTQSLGSWLAEMKRHAGLNPENP